MLTKEQGIRLNKTIRSKIDAHPNESRVKIADSIIRAGLSEGASFEAVISRVDRVCRQLKYDRPTEVKDRPFVQQQTKKRSILNRFSSAWKSFKAHE